jgi:hypothetical protein
MIDPEVFTHTVVVSAEAAFGYLEAATQVPGVRVEAVVPRDDDHGRLLTAEHVGTLLREHRGGLGDSHQLGVFTEAAHEAVVGAFVGPDADGVLVRIRTARDDGMYSRLDAVVMMAAGVGVLSE